MNKGFLRFGLLLATLYALTLFAKASPTTKPSSLEDDPYQAAYVVAQTDTIPPIQDRQGDFITNPNTNPFDLKDPSIIEKDVEYDPITNQYIITERIGEEYYRTPTYMTFQEYLDYKAKQQEQAYFQQLSGVGSASGSLGANNPLDRIDIKQTLIDRLFGGTSVDIRPQGSIDLTFGVDYSKLENPILTRRQQTQGGFDFDMAIQMNVTGKIGEKLNLSTNYNTQATFDFDNQLKLDYNTDAFSEDEIIKKIEAGNVSLPLRGTLIQGAQSLFGLKTELQFGHLRLTMIASQQKSEREEIEIQGGSQLQEFSVFADEYDENRHFLLSHFNRNTFEEALENLPQIKSLFKIERIQVWVTNDRNVTTREGQPGPRDIVAFADLGEGEVLLNPEAIPGPTSAAPRDITGRYILPSNESNGLYEKLVNAPQARKIDRTVATLKSGQFGLQQSRDFEKVTARLLNESEYTVHPELGFVSININLQPDQVLGVAYQYSYNGRTYTVGELSKNQSATNSEGDPEVLYVKMLKATTPRVDLPIWDLMMKNVYNIGAYQVNPQDFRLDIFYEDPGGGFKRFLPETNLQGVPLLRVFNLDRLNTQGDPQPDGVFDYVPGVTIFPQGGRIMFPVLEPFGSALAEQITNPNLARKYVYQQLYDSTVFVAQEYPELNRFTISGSYRSSVSSEISLGAFNIPPGSVQVSAGGQRLREGIDYEIDYNIGRIKILNDAYLQSGVPIRVSFEDNSIFGFQTKTLLGMRADYEGIKNWNIGATYLKLFERPYTQKVNIGDDPINNTIYGLDVNYSAEAPWLTRIIDRLPLISTKAPSNFSFMAEAAALQPGHARAINENSGKDKGGVVYIDDFEGSTSSNDLRSQVARWALASVPQNDARNNNPLFPEADAINNLHYGVNRARLNWYRIDPSVRLGQNDARNPYTAVIDQEEVFPNRQIPPNELPTIQTFDLVYYPSERGPYNFDVPGGTPYSAGLTSQGQLAQPETRWAGIMRSMDINNFESANIEFIELWVLSPFLNKPGSSSLEGDLYINLGNVSEDILRDSRQAFENGLPTPNNPERAVDTTTWSVVPRRPPVADAFDNDPASLEAQDIGLDGLDDNGERAFYAEYLQQLTGVDQPFLQSIIHDPANDNYRSIFEYEDNVPLMARYEKFNNPQGNSRRNDQGKYSPFTQIPDSEDLDNDNTLNETESYFQYRIPIRYATGGKFPGRGMEPNAYITDEIPSEDGQRIWYRLRIPINDPTRVAVGGIQDLRSVRFMRLYMTGFQDTTIFRFARMELVRNQWRRYSQPLGEPGAIIGGGDGSDQTVFDVNSVNIEENSEVSDSRPFAYVLPEGIQRERNVGVFNYLQNEQSLSMRVENLKDGDARAIFKNTQLDLRFYERLRMFVHAEAIKNCGDNIQPGDVSIFLRIGSDFKNNYYEYEIPLSLSLDTVPIPTNGSRAGSAYVREVWKENNEFDFPLEWLRQLKISRNNAGASLTEVYDSRDAVGEDLFEGLKDGHIIKVVGNPNLGLVRGVMIGIRNPKTNDADKYCVEVWVNELRVNGLDEKGGYAATARADMQLADLGALTVSANYSSIGFGGLDQQLYERQREEYTGFDVAANVNLDKFLPENWGIRIPAYAAYSRNASTPQYDPYDLDIPLKDKLAAAETAEARDSIKSQAQDATTIKSLSFNNVRKERTGNAQAKPMPWNIENFSVTYAYSETENTDPIIESDLIENQRLILDYTYSRPVTYIEPFKKLIGQNKYLQLLGQFNFNPLPNSFSFSTELERYFAETRYRFTGGDPLFSTFYNKRFTWDRNYNVQWDIAKGLKFNFNATNFAVIDEPDEIRMRQDPTINDIDAYRRDSIWQGIQQFGRNKNYTHNFNVNYTLPTKLIPFLDWVNVRATYNGDYNWSAAALNVVNLGNVIQNGQRRQVNGDLDFDRLYNQIGYLQRINQPARAARGQQQNTRTRSRTDPSGNATEEEPKKEVRQPSKIERIVIRPLLLLRKARLTYSEQFNTVVPGFLPQSELLGMNGFDAPGWGFISGFQPEIRTLEIEDYGSDRDWLNKASKQGWITSDVYLNQPVIQEYRQTADAQVTLEPFPDFRIEITAKRNFTENHSQYYKDTLDNGVNEWVHAVPRNIGSLNLSYFALNTMFQDDLGQIKALFRKFEDNRAIISQRLGRGLHDDDTMARLGFTKGYGRTQQEVLIPSFIAAYTDQDAETMELGESKNYTKDVLSKKLPLPNWRLTYNGLSKLPLFNKLFQSVNVTHGYGSTLTVNSFQTDIDFLQSPGSINPVKFDFYSRLEVPEIVISEQFSPLLAIDVRLINDMSFNLDFKKARTLAMSFVSEQLAETQTQEYTVGFGWRLREVNIGFLTGKKTTRKRPTPEAEQPPQNPQNRPNNRSPRGSASGVGDLDINFAFSLRDDVTFNHILDQNIVDPTRGARTLSLSPSAEYQLNQRLALRFFVDYNKTVPKVSTSFPITNVQGGVVVRFTLN